MRNIFTITALILLGICFTSCKEEENNPIPPPEEQPQVNLSLEDASCTEAWIKLSTGSLALPSDVDLYRDSSIVDTINLTSEDTVLYVDSLLPNHTYKYQSVIQSTGQSSNLLSVTTMDTTSHNFSFQTWTFGGQAGSCVLNDVAIIDENNIWAVGEIYLLDSLGQPDPDRYNLAVWNGNNWEIKRVPYYYQGQPFYHPIRSVFAFGANDIWFCGNGLIHWDGNQYNPVAVPNWGPYWMNEIWGTSDNDLYVVGDNGHIAHYQNGQWSRIESGTDLNINDIYGAYNQKTNQYEILAVASDYGQSFEKEILSIQENEQVISHSSDSNPTMEPLLGVWFIPSRQYYVVGSGIYQKHSLADKIWKNNQYNITTFATTSISGNEINDVFVVGAFGDFDHFNGVSWKNDYLDPLLSNGSYTSVAVKGDLVVAIGSNQVSLNSEAVILMGRR